MAAFPTKRFDRKEGLRVPMQSLAAFTGADFRSPESLDYVNFLRATHKCTNDVREKALAFERVVFNIAFNNRDDHPKSFAYIMDVMGEALEIEREHLLDLAQEAEVGAEAAAQIIERFCKVTSRLSDLAERLYPGVITTETLHPLQNRIDHNIELLG